MRLSLEFALTLLGMSLVTCFGFLSHTSMLAIIFSSPALRKAPSISFVVSLSITGLLASLVVFPSAISVFFDYRSDPAKWLLLSHNCSTVPAASTATTLSAVNPNYVHNYSVETCSIMRVLHNFSIFYSAWLVSAIAVDRNWSIARPFRRPPTMLQSLVTNSIMAIASIASAVMSVLLATSYPVCHTVYFQRVSGAVLSWFPFAIFYLLPMVIVFSMYSNIYRAAQRARAVDQPVTRIWTVEPATTPAPNAFRSRRANKAFRTLLLTVGTYIALWSPYWWMPVVVLSMHQAQDDRPFCSNIPLYVMDDKAAVFTWLMYASICINPLLYGLLDRTVRSEIMRRWRKLHSCCNGRWTPPTDQHPHQDLSQTGPENFWEFLERTNDSLSP